MQLPMAFEQFSYELQQLRMAYFERTIGPLLEATRGIFVLRGRGAAEVCILLNGVSCQCKPSEFVIGDIVLDSSLTHDALVRISSGTDAFTTITVAGVAVVRARDDELRHAHHDAIVVDPILHYNLGHRLTLTNET